MGMQKVVLGAYFADFDMLKLDIVVDVERRKFESSRAPGDLFERAERLRVRVALALAG